MRPRRLVRFLPLLLLLAGCATQPPTKLLPGVTYYDGPEKLTGRLTFLLNHDSIPETNTDSSASIYEFDLSSKTLRKVTNSPKGLFIPSFHGDMFCVIYRPGNWFHSDDTNAFVYSDSLRQSRTVNIDKAPKGTAIVGGHVFFEVEDNNTPGLRDYDIARDQMRRVELSDASRWQYCHYDRIHVPRGQTNVLHFYYNGFGNRLGSGKDYRDAYYSLDTRTGDMRWLDDEDDDGHTFKAFDGRYIFFEGSEAPIIGFRLLSSPWDDWHTKDRGAKEPEVKVLKSFSKLAAFGRGYYVLHAISPDGRFAFVSFDEATVPKLMEQSGWARTYYAVDVTNGKIRLLLRQNVEHTTNGSMSGVWWVESPS